MTDFIKTIGVNNMEATVGLQITKWLSSKKDLKWLKSEQRRLKTKGIETVIVEEKNGTDKKHALCRTKESK